MDWSLLISNIPFVAASTWIALGIGLGVGVTVTLVAPWSSTTRSSDVTSWRARRLRGLGVGLACGTLFGSLFVFFVGADRGSPATGFIVLPAVAGALVGQAVAGAIASAKGREQITRRVGHSKAVSLGDYVSSPVLWTARVLVLTAAVALILQYLIAARTTPDESPTVYPQVSAFVVLPALFVLIVTEIGARILITRASSADSVDALRRQDLQRVRIVRDGAGSALSLGVLAFLISVPQLIAAIDPRAEILAIASPPISAFIISSTVICVALSIVFSFRARVLPPPSIRHSNKLGGASR